MKKRRNIAAAIVLSSMMAVSTCAFTVTSMTASAGSLYSSDTNANYEAFQLLKGTLGTVDENGNGSLGNAQWGTALTGGLQPALLNTLKADTTFGTGSENAFYNLTTSSTPTQFAAALATLNSDAKKEQFAKIIGNSLSTGGTQISGTSSSDATTVDDGYYVIKGTNSTGTTLNLLKVAGNLEITGKTGVPSSDKKVTDVNDSRGDSVANQTSADYDIGDSIPYVLTFTLPSNYDKYKTYPITFIDDMCAGLTYNNDAVIYYNTDTSGEGTSIHESTGTVKFAASEDTSSFGSGNGTIYKCSIADLKTHIPTYSDGAKVTIKYSATLNSNAVIGNAGNPNEYKVSYASDPNYIPPSSGTPTPPTSETPPSTNKVYTYQLVINKTDGTNPLKGANFTLFKLVNGSGSDTATIDGTDYTGTWTNVTTLGSNYHPSKSAVDTNTMQFTFNGLDDGIYKLVESATPDGYNTIDPVIFTITAEHSDTGITTLSAAGGSLTFTGNTSTGALSVDIVNNQGATLPSTGGIGTTLFYIIGGTLVAGSIVLLITKKRMHSTEE